MTPRARGFQEGDGRGCLQTILLFVGFFVLVVCIGEYLRSPESVERERCAYLNKQFNNYMPLPPKALQELKDCQKKYLTLKSDYTK